MAEENRAFTAASFNTYLTKEKKLVGVRCRACGTLSPEPRPMCHSCHWRDMEWYEFSGKGKLSTFTCISIVPAHMMEKGYGRDNPYCTGVVELKEKARVVARLKGVDSINPDTIKVGLPVKVEFLKEGSDSNVHTILGFKPIES